MIPSVLSGYLLQIKLRDAPIGETLAFIVDQINRIIQGEEGSATTAAVSNAFPLAEMVSGGRQDETVYERRDGRMLPIADRSVWTEPQITADQPAFNLGLRFYNRLSTDSTRSILGILPSLNGRRALIVNIGAQRLILQHENAGAASASYRILCVGSANILLLQNDMALIWRDNASDRWRAAQL